MRALLTEQEDIPYLEGTSQSFKVLLTLAMALRRLVAYERVFIGDIIFTLICGNIKG